jgi:hypothetical protein
MLEATTVAEIRNILYCNVLLAGRSGTEIVTIDTVRGLHKRGYNIGLYVSIHGESSRALTDNGILVTSDLNEIPWRPDIIHSNHITQSLEAAVRFPDTPQVHLCHDADAWFSNPPRLSLVRRWLAVDEVCAERIRGKIGVGTKVFWLPNAVDIETHPMRGALPQQPRRALILTKNKGYFNVIVAACKTAGVQVDKLGLGTGVVVADLPQHFQRYDVVFATARMAIEALACGCAVVVVDARGLAGLVTSINVRNWRRHNFGRRLLARAITAAAIRNELIQFDSLDARKVSSYIREEAALSTYLDILIKIYRDAIDDFEREPVDPRITLRESFTEFHSLLSLNKDTSVYDVVQDLKTWRSIKNSPIWPLTSPLRSIRRFFLKKH